jgi:hypothetical protein
MTDVQCFVLARFTNQGFVSGVRSDAFLFLASQIAVRVATCASTIMTAGALGLIGGICANLKIHGGLYIYRPSCIIYVDHRAPGWTCS